MKSKNLLNITILIILTNQIRCFGSYRTKPYSHSHHNSHRSHTKDKTIDEFKLRFTALKIANFENQETMDILNTMEKIFFKNYHKYKHKITSNKLEMSLADNLSAYANAHKYDESLGAHTYGMKTGKDYTKILISGARGTKKSGYENKNEISTLGLCEIIERFQTGISAAFASETFDGQYFIDAKVNEETDDCKMNEEGQFEISHPTAKKYIIHSVKTAIGTTKIFRLLAGKDYLKLIVNLLVSGASVKDKAVLSKSSISVKVYLTNDEIAGGTDKTFVNVSKNLGFFSSENKTNHERSISNHVGYLMIQKGKKGNSNQATRAHAIADKELGTHVASDRIASKFETGSNVTSG